MMSRTFEGPAVPEGQELIKAYMKDRNIGWCEYQPSTFEANYVRKLLRFSVRLVENARS